MACLPVCLPTCLTRTVALTDGGLQYPSEIIRDLSSYVNYTQPKRWLGVMVVYLFLSFLFFRLYLANDINLTISSLDHATALAKKIQGSNGDWDTINTLVFMFTTFTTVGYGNHPSFVTTTPPCEYPGAHSKTDSPFSNLMPLSMRQEVFVHASDVSSTVDSFAPLPDVCFTTEGGTGNAACWVVADDSSIFHFEQLLHYDRATDHVPR